MKKPATIDIHEFDSFNDLDTNNLLMVDCGTILRKEDGRFILKNKKGLFTAIPAFSCMVQPEISDRVLFSRDDENQYYVLSILERKSMEKSKLQFPGEVQIEAGKGQISMVAENGINMISNQNIDMISPTFMVTAGQGDIHIDRITAIGDQFTGKIKFVKLLADTFDTIADRISQRVKNYFRIVEELDQLNAGELMHRVRKTLSIQSLHAMITAKKDVKIDGERIHMG